MATEAPLHPGDWIPGPNDPPAQSDSGWQPGGDRPIRVGQKPPPPGPGTFTSSVVAGAIESGFRDGPPSSARFGRIVALDRDGTGNLYVADASNHRIRKLDRYGQVTTLAGTGEPVERDGPALDAAFRELRALGVDAAGNCYVLDGENLRRLSAMGVVSTVGSIRIPTGEQSYTNHGGPFWDPVLETCIAEEWFRVSCLAVSSVGEVFVLGTATKQVRSDWLKWSVSHLRQTTNTQVLIRHASAWEAVVTTNRFHFTCSGCVPAGTPPPDSVEGRLIVALSKGAARGILTASEECRGTAGCFGRVDAVDQRVEQTLAANLGGLPKITHLAEYQPDAILLLGQGDSGNGLFQVGLSGATSEVPANRAPDIGLVVSPQGIVYSATPTEVLRFVPEGIVVLDLEAIPSEGTTLVLSTVASAGRRIRVEHSLDLRFWEVWQTFTSSGRDEWEVGIDPDVRWFRARIE